MLFNFIYILNRIRFICTFRLDRTVESTYSYNKNSELEENTLSGNCL